MANLVKRFLSKQDLKDIADAISAAEQHTSGEIRVAVRQKRAKKEKDMTVEQLARHEFVHLGMARTDNRTGILIFILLDSREFYILADEHIHKKVAEGTWHTIAAAMSSHFTKKEFRHGVLAAVRSVGDQLAEHFPAKPGGKNELPNNVVVS